VCLHSCVTRCLSNSSSVRAQVESVLRRRFSVCQRQTVDSILEIRLRALSNSDKTVWARVSSIECWVGDRKFEVTLVGLASRALGHCIDRILHLFGGQVWCEIARISFGLQRFDFCATRPRVAFGYERMSVKFRYTNKPYLRFLLLGSFM
jgi:hypothetical protein